MSKVRRQMANAKLYLMTLFLFVLRFQFMLDYKLKLRLVQTPRQNDRSDNRHQQQNADDLDRKQILRVHRPSEAQGFTCTHRLIGGNIRGTHNGVKNKEGLSKQDHAQPAA